MFDTFALLLSDAYQALGFPAKEHLDPEDLTRAAVQTLAFFGLDAAQSEFGRASKTVPLRGGSRDFLLSAAPDLATPMYIERRSGNPPHETWEWVPLVRASVVEEARGKGWPVASLVREDNGYRVHFSYDPTGVDHRLRYYTDPVMVADREDSLPLPARYGFMFTHKTVINAVPMMLARSSQLPEEQQMSTAQLNALSAVVAHAQSELQQWLDLWQTEKTADRSVRGRNRRPLVPRGW